jgi:hypothetical protein
MMFTVIYLQAMFRAWCVGILVLNLNPTVSLTVAIKPEADAKFIMIDM